MYHHHKTLSCPTGYTPVGGRCVPSSAKVTIDFDDDVIESSSQSSVSRSLHIKKQSSNSRVFTPHPRNNTRYNTRWAADNETVQEQRSTHIGLKNTSRIYNGALLSKASYDIGNHGMKKGTPMANERVNDIGYVVVEDSELSDRHITTFYNKDLNQYNIVHKGTQIDPTAYMKEATRDMDFIARRDEFMFLGAKDPSGQIQDRKDDRTGFQDLANDFGLALGYKTPDAADWRARRTKQIINKIDNELSQGKERPTIAMNGHSWGAFTAGFALSHSKAVRDRIDHSDMFDAGHNPFSDVGLRVDKKARAQLGGGKHVHHRIKSDAVSKGMNYNKPKEQSGLMVRTYKLSDPTNPELTKEKIQGMSAPTKALVAHDLQHFLRPNLRLDHKHSDLYEGERDIIAEKQASALDQSQNERKESLSGEDFIMPMENYSVFHSYNSEPKENSEPQRGNL